MGAMDINRFGQKIKQYRKKQRLSQLELSRRSGVPQPLISELEACKREGVTLDVAWRLARHLSVSLDHLAGTWEDDEETSTVVKTLSQS
jgi:transcriptional regulator with XRE-family HTH domain